jgi:DNA-binding response OmpR family regulator
MLKSATVISELEMALRILFVEDHTDTSRMLGQLLRYFHYMVVTAPDYETALRMLNESRFDVLLSDVALPDGNGCDLVIQAKSKQPLVAIALTALGTLKEEECDLSCGFDHYFVKPLHFQELRKVLDGIRPSPVKKLDHEKALSELIKNRLGNHVTCSVFENQLSAIWPRAYKHDSRIKEIEAFAKANGWSVTISDPGIRLTFKKLKV